MSTVTLTRVFRKDVDTRYGIKPKVSIQTSEHGEKWLSTFKTKGTESWEEGMTVQVNVEEKGDFMNFTPVGVVNSSASAASTVQTSDLTARVAKLEQHVFGQPEIKTANTTVVDTEEDDDIEGDF